MALSSKKGNAIRNHGAISESVKEVLTGTAQKIWKVSHSAHLVELCCGDGHILHSAVQIGSHQPHVTVKHLKRDWGTGLFLMTFKQSHMATILDSSALWPFTHPQSYLKSFSLSPPTSPVSKMIEILKHVLYKLLYLNLILPTKKKLESSHKDSRWQGAWDEWHGLYIHTRRSQPI